MIRARSLLGAQPFAALLARKAARLAAARAETRLLTRRDAPRKWRSARLLWPLFSTED